MNDRLKELQAERSAAEKEAEELYIKICRAVIDVTGCDDVGTEKYRAIMDQVLQYGLKTREACDRNNDITIVIHGGVA